MFELLEKSAFTMATVPVRWTELLGDGTGLLCVWLLARQSIWSWPIGLLNNLFFLALFVATKLYGDAALQVVFALLGVYGWWSWKRRAPGGEALNVHRTSARTWALMAAASVVGTASAAYWLDRHTDSPVPLWDASVLVGSLLATYGQARKLLESWWIWIAVDIISIPLYASRGLYPTAGVYAVFLAICVAGLRDWRHSLERTADSFTTGER